ncbi:MAG: hypothetical protein VX589_12420 [Myxococcota bacterium]|nr:hypothetical protein [Myxococcota bacterium]
MTTWVRGLVFTWLACLWGCASQALSLDDPSAFPMTLEPPFLYSDTQDSFTVTANDLTIEGDRDIEPGEVDVLGVTVDGQTVDVIKFQFIEQFKVSIELAVDASITRGFRTLVVEIRNRYGAFTLSRQVEIY